jgi:hypothetical protein
MKHERPRHEARGAVGDSRHDHPTVPTPADKDLPEGTITLADALAELVDILPGLKAALDRQSGQPRLAYRLDELAAALGMSRRALERERAAGRLPKPDLQIGLAPLWKPSTLEAWITRGGSK